MTGPIVPADQWPKDAVAHAWGGYGGRWLTYSGVIPSNIPMPAGYDWRVPVMRPVAAAKGGEQIADIVADWDANRCGPFKAMKRIKKLLDSLTFQPGNDLHIGYKAGTPEVVAWRWRKPVVNDQGETSGATAWVLSDVPGFLPWWENEPLTRLSDYAALQAENERLKAERVDLEQFRAALVALSDYAYERHGDADHPHCLEADRLLALIDGQPNDNGVPHTRSDGSLRSAAMADLDKMARSLLADQYDCDLPGSRIAKTLQGEFEGQLRVADIIALAAIRAALMTAPPGYVLVPAELIDAFPEINPSNYDHDQACRLNAWGCEVVTCAAPEPEA